MFEQYIRIYPINIHGNELAIQYTENEERQLLEKTTNTAGYKQQAMSILMQLKKKEPILEIVASSSSSISLDQNENNNNNNNPSIKLSSSSSYSSSSSSLSLFQSKNKELDYNIIEKLILTKDQLKAMGYPLLSDLNDNKNQDDHNNNELSSTSTSNQRKCDRCNKNYIVKSILNANEMKACQYHFGKLRVIQSFGDKQRTYTCCNDPIGAPGCQQGPHVFKGIVIVIIIDHEEHDFIYLFIYFLILFL